MFLGFVFAVSIVPQASLAADKEEAFAYLEIQPPQQTSTGNKIEVVEMFWYGCPHCYRFEPHIKAWEKQLPEDVEFVRMPAVFNAKWAFHARVFYTAEVLGVLDKVHGPIFDAIHKQRKRLDDLDEVTDFLAAHGVDKDEFTSTFQSFAVNSKVSWAQRQTRAYGIDGVPALVVQGKYRTSASMAGGHEQALDVVDALIAKERK
ncbi:MAG: thiol:disulfide interchange protein DsbA/DsbL [Gammaproteobacteria bacterium]|nr:thiol:disulfide interchange protein DsbA/DsbL [Gammaproteobacteria bacterium]